MRPHLLFRDKDFSATASLGYNSDTIAADLELKRIIDCMAGEDDVISRAAASALFNPLTDLAEIQYRQEALADCLAYPDAVRAIYSLCVEADVYQSRVIKGLKMNAHLYETYLEAAQLIKNQLDQLAQIRNAVSQNAGGFRSKAFTGLADTLSGVLTDAYLGKLNTLIKELLDKDGFLISASLGMGLEGIQYTLCRKSAGLDKMRWRFAPSLTVDEEKDMSAVQDFKQRRDRAINGCVEPLGKTAEHIARFVNILRGELAFYIGCLNLHKTLTGYGLPVCTPKLGALDSQTRAWQGLIDVSLAMRKQSGVSGNELAPHDAEIHIITGANQGGKSTFLRSFGQAQLMAQCGMFTAAASFTAPVRVRLYTHFRKEEDAGMNKGKLDEELTRMDKLLNKLAPGMLILFNESFASTNEREGSEICRQVTTALTEAKVEVFIVSHMYAYASGYLDKPGVQFLQAERLSGGERTFRIVEGAPTVTAYGEDLYRKIFNA